MFVKLFDYRRYARGFFDALRSSTKQEIHAEWLRKTKGTYRTLITCQLESRKGKSCRNKKDIIKGDKKKGQKQDVLLTLGKYFKMKLICAITNHFFV